MAEARKCECGTWLIDTPLVREALTYWDEVCYHGNLHSFVQDGNLEDEFFRLPPGEPRPNGYTTAREDVEANRAGMPSGDVAIELRLVSLLERMTEVERLSCYGSCMACREENDRQLGWKQEA